MSAVTTLSRADPTVDPGGQAAITITIRNSGLDRRPVRRRRRRSDGRLGPRRSARCRCSRASRARSRSPSRRRARARRGPGSTRSASASAPRPIRPAPRSRRGGSRSRRSPTVAADIVPQTSRGSRVGRHQVVVANRGNAPSDVTVNAERPRSPAQARRPAASRRRRPGRTHRVRRPRRGRGPVPVRRGPPAPVPDQRGTRPPAADRAPSPRSASGRCCRAGSRPSPAVVAIVAVLGIGAFLAKAGPFAPNATPIPRPRRRSYQRTAVHAAFSGAAQRGTPERAAAVGRAADPIADARAAQAWRLQADRDRRRRRARRRPERPVPRHRQALPQGRQGSRPRDGQRAPATRTRARASSAPAPCPYPTRCRCVMSADRDFELGPGGLAARRARRRRCVLDLEPAPGIAADRRLRGRDHARRDPRHRVRHRCRPGHAAVRQPVPARPLRRCRSAPATPPPGGVITDPICDGSPSGRDPAVRSPVTLVGITPTTVRRRRSAGRPHRPYLSFSALPASTAWAAARRATGTRNGEQDT